MPKRLKLTLLLVLVLVLVLIGLPARTLAQDPPALESFTDDIAGIQGVRPVGWQDAGGGLYTRGATPTDPTLIALQAAPVTLDDLWPALLPQFALTEIPEALTTVETASLSWQVYRIDYDTDAIQLTLDLALAHQNGTSYILLLQAAPDEYEILHATVFEPMLAAFAPVAADTSDLPYRVEEVTFGSGDLTLAGTLTLPEGDGPHPAVVLMTGTGPQSRDSLVGRFPIFRIIADELTRNGIAVLRYDDRGVGASGGDYDTASIYDFADDGQAAMDYLQTRPDINAAEVGLLGHSEGSVYASIIGANPESGVAFVILVAGPGLRGDELLLVQNEDILQLAGATADLIEREQATLRAAFPLIHARDWDGYLQLIYEAVMVNLEDVSAEALAAAGISDPEAYARQIAEQRIQIYGNESFATLMDYDPAPDLAQIAVPILALFGALDVQVAPDAHIPPMEAAFADSGNPDTTIITLAGANHLFQAAEQGGIEEYGVLEPTFTAEFLPTVVDWLLERVTVSG